MVRQYRLGCGKILPPSQVFAKVALMITRVNRKVVRSVAEYADDNLSQHR